MPKLNKSQSTIYWPLFPESRKKEANHQNHNVLMIKCRYNCYPDNRKERSSKIKEDFFSLPFTLFLRYKVWAGSYKNSWILDADRVSAHLADVTRSHVLKVTREMKLPFIHFEFYFHNSTDYISV